MITYLGIGAVALFGLSWLMNKDSKSNYGSTQNSIYPIFPGTQSQDTYVHPAILAASRGFPDYSNRSNTIPTPFVELNMPRNAFSGPGVRIANTREQGIYVPTFDGQPYLLHPQI